MWVALATWVCGGHWRVGEGYAEGSPTQFGLNAWQAMSAEREDGSVKDERSGLGPMVVLLLVIGPLLYLLSTGPVLWLESRGYGSEWTDSVLRVIYSPIRLLIENSEAVEKVFKDWASLWQN